MDVVHGFAQLRSPVTNATKHIGFQYTVSFDLADFFDTVTPTKGKATLVAPVKTKVSRKRYTTTNTELWHDGIARQGLPTSPIVANLAAADMDAAILALNGSHDCEIADVDLQFTYTRYADDLCFSFNSPELIAVLKRRIPQIVEAAGFKVNERKTTVQCAAAGRRIVTGVAVDDELHPTRAAKRRLRAARHNVKTGKVKHFPLRQWTRHIRVRKYHGQSTMPKRAWMQRWLLQRVAGLAEWCKLKMPGVGYKSTERIMNAMEGVEALTAIAGRKVP